MAQDAQVARKQEGAHLSLHHDQGQEVWPEPHRLPQQQRPGHLRRAREGQRDQLLRRRAEGQVQRQVLPRRAAQLRLASSRARGAQGREGRGARGARGGARIEM